MPGFEIDADFAKYRRRKRIGIVVLAVWIVGVLVLFLAPSMTGSSQPGRTVIASFEPAAH